MYNAPDFVKVDMNVSESFATYSCEAMYDGQINYIMNYEGCEEYKAQSQESVLSGSRGGTYECYIVENVL